MRNALLVAASLFVLTACPDPAKDKPKATVTAPVPTPSAPTGDKPATPPAPLANATAYPFTQEGSKVSFVGAKVTGKHDGGFNTFGGIIELVENDPTKGRVRASIDMASAFTDSEKLTGHLKSPDFFDVEKFKEAIFESTAIAKKDDKFEVSGNLTLHGVTKGITFPASITVSADEVTVAAEFAINRKDFSIIYPGKPDDLIADNVALKLDLHAKKKAAVPAQ
ncbi:MAG: YceI family protein [Archangium sp.]